MPEMFQRVSTPPDVEAVNLEQGVALLTTGETVPITAMLDERGYECPPEEAVAVVCGSDEVGWFNVDRSLFVKAPVQ